MSSGQGCCRWMACVGLYECVHSGVTNSKMLYYVLSELLLNVIRSWSVTRPPFATDSFISMRPYSSLLRSLCLRQSLHTLHTTTLHSRVQYDSRWTCYNGRLMYWLMIYVMRRRIDWVKQRCLGGTSGCQRADWYDTTWIVGRCLLAERVHGRWSGSDEAKCTMMQRRRSVYTYIYIILSGKDAHITHASKIA